MSKVIPTERIPGGQWSKKHQESISLSRQHFTGRNLQNYFATLESTEGLQVSGKGLEGKL